MRSRVALAAGLLLGLASAPAAAISPAQQAILLTSQGVLYNDFTTGAIPGWLAFSGGANGTVTSCATGLIVAASAPRIDCTGGTANGLLVEEGRTNSVPNSSWTGATSSSPGTGWGAPTTVNGIALSFASGTENGLPYIDATFSGTATAATTVVIQSPQFAVTNGQAYTASTYLSVKNGSLSSNVIAYYGMNSFNSGGSYLQTPIEQNISANPASTSLLNNRFSQSATLNSSSTAFGSYTFGIIVPNGQSVNHTIRFGGVQIEQGGFVSSVILTTSGPVARTADVAQFAGQALALLQNCSVFGCSIVAENTTANYGNYSRLIGTNAPIEYTPLSFGNGSSQVGAYNGSSLATTGFNYANGAFGRSAGGVSPNGRTVAGGGLASASDSGTYNTAGLTFYLGADYYGGSYGRFLDGYTRKLALYGCPLTGLGAQAKTNTATPLPGGCQ